LNSVVEAHRYGEVTALMRDMPSGSEDNVASHLNHLFPPQIL